jgi:NADH-quinone oxidoreductase subunit E
LAGGIYAPPDEHGDCHLFARQLRKHCEDKLGVKLGESTADGRVYLKKEEECLAACCGAPMMVVDGRYHVNLTAEKVDEILDGLK